MWLPVGLAAAGLLAILAEMFLPTAGVLGAAGLGSIIASIVVVFRRFGGQTGALYLAAVAVLIPVLIALYFKYFPRSPMGRWLMIRKAPGDGQDGARGVQSGGGPPAEPGPYAGLAGREGRTLTALHPVGLVLIGDRKYSAVSGGEFIERDRQVKVLKVEGSRILVRESMGGEA
jgi:membrane-bound serine protease (ClpP class)